MKEKERGRNVLHFVFRPMGLSNTSDASIFKEIYLSAPSFSSLKDKHGYNITTISSSPNNYQISQKVIFLWLFEMSQRLEVIILETEARGNKPCDISSGPRDTEAESPDLRDAIPQNEFQTSPLSWKVSRYCHIKKKKKDSTCSLINLDIWSRKCLPLLRIFSG